MRLVVWLLASSDQDRHIANRSLVERFEVLEPLLQCHVVRILLFELMPIAQQMHPAALMQALIAIVGGIEVAAQHTLEAFPQQLLDHLTASGMMVLIVADGAGTHTPDVAILAIFSPPRFIGLDGGAGPNLLLERCHEEVQLIGSAVQQLHDFSTADLQPMQGGQVGLDLPHG